MPKLIITSAGETRLVDLRPSENTLGRSASNDIVLNSIYASRRHAVIEVQSAFTTIRDLGSQNGTYVNGERVQSQPLVEGDLVQVGGCDLRFVGGDQEFREVEAQALSSIPNWVVDEDGRPTAPDVPKARSEDPEPRS